MSVVAVADAGPIIHLAEIDALSLFDALDRLLVPRTVYREIEDGGVPPELEATPFDVVTPETAQFEGERLDPGETAALAVAEEREAVLLTDDLAAREVATEAGIDVHGSIGVVALAHGRSIVDRDEATSRMRALQRETSLFVTDAVVERGIQWLRGDEERK